MQTQRILSFPILIFIVCMNAILISGPFLLHWGEKMAEVYETIMSPVFEMM